MSHESSKGFLGAGAILKQSSQQQIKGLTTAANIWLTAAAGMAVGGGFIALAVFGTALALLTLVVVGRIERVWVDGPKRHGVAPDGDERMKKTSEKE